MTGDSETFYIHKLTKYMHVFLKHTYDDHKLGVGVFTMEGFKYKNYSSKPAVREHSNQKGNVCVQNSKFMTLQFIFKKADVNKEIVKRNRRKKIGKKYSPSANAMTILTMIELCFKKYNYVF